VWQEIIRGGIKMKIYMDVDGCLVKSKKQVTKYLNQRYNRNIKWKDIKDYNLQDHFPEVSLDEIEDIFADPNFYPDCEFYKGAMNFIENSGHEIVFCTKGTPQNLYYKTLILNYYFPTIPIITLSNSLSKRTVDMSDGVLVDDYDVNINICNAKYKIVFAPEGETDYNTRITTNNVFYAQSFKHLTRLLKLYFQGGNSND